MHNVIKDAIYYYLSHKQLFRTNAFVHSKLAVCCECNIRLGSYNSTGLQT